MPWTAPIELWGFAAIYVPMQRDEPRARIAYGRSAITQAKQLFLKGLVVLGGTVMLVSAIMVSLVFVAIGLAIVLIFGGYLWWKTRELRRQFRAQMQGRPPAGDVIEGEVIPEKRAASQSQQN